MSWKKELNLKKGKNKDYSIRNRLKEQYKINDLFEVMLSNLSLEDIISLKLELSSNYINNRMYNFPLWSAIPYITKEAILKYSLSATRSKRDGARFLGMRLADYNKLLKKYNIETFFEENEEKT